MKHENITFKYMNNVKTKQNQQKKVKIKMHAIHEKN